MKRLTYLTKTGDRADLTYIKIHSIFSSGNVIRKKEFLQITNYLLLGTLLINFLVDYVRQTN